MTDKDKEYADKDNEHENSCEFMEHQQVICSIPLLARSGSVSGWCGHVSRDSKIWHEDGAAAEVGWSLFHLEKEGKTAIVVRNKDMNFLKHARRSTRWVIFVLESILFLSLYLPHTWEWRTEP